MWRKIIFYPVYWNEVKFIAEFLLPLREYFAAWLKGVSFYYTRVCVQLWPTLTRISCDSCCESVRTCSKHPIYFTAWLTCNRPAQKAKADCRFGSNETARPEWGNGFNYNPRCCLERRAINWYSHGAFAWMPTGIFLTASIPQVRIIPSPI
jgi:hypothetical protein